jgi:tetratricopeptide (TPR) repeat protein
MTFVSNPRRDASPTIAGFVFQVNVTILRWLGLRDGEHLELECGEDVDTVQNGHQGGITAEARLLEQIKARSGRSLTLRSTEALQALSNFCSHRAANPTSNLTFRYITTANSGIEQGWGRPESGIETWTAVRSGRYDDTTQHEAIAALRTLLRSCTRPEKVPADVWQDLQHVLASDDDTYLTEVILGLEWGVGYGNLEQSEIDILRELTLDGLAETPEETKQVYEHLFAFVFRLLSHPGKKLLNISHLTAERQTPWTLADRDILQLVRNELEQMAQRIDAVETAIAHQAKDVIALRHTVGLIGKSFGFNSAFELSAVSVSTQLPDLVNPCAARGTLVDDLLSRAQADGTVVLVAEPGSGKTQLLVLALGKAGRRAHWLNIPRDATEAQACVLLDALIRLAGGQLHNLPFRESCDAAAEQFRGGIVVIDDLPRMVPGGPLTVRIETLARCLKGADAHLFMSSYYRLPATTERSLGQIHCDVPRFTTIDVAELLASSGAPQLLRAEKTYQLLVSVTEGLPTLVMAAVRYLANRNWHFTSTELESLFRGEFASAHRHDATSLLQVTLPDAEERQLLIRLSLAIGEFSMDDIASVARVRTAIPLPGEKVQRATGLWLQQVGNGRYLRSPLITSSLADSLDPTTRARVHYILAVRILARKSLAPMEVFTCVHHLTMAGDMTYAVIVVIQILAAFIELDKPVKDEFGFARMWSLGPVPSDVDINLQLYLRAMQIVALDNQGRNVLPMVERLDALIAEVRGKGWGVAIATSMLAVHLALGEPILANKYLLEALGSFADARLLDGSPLPSGDYPLEIILWMSAYSSKSDADVDSWLATILRFTPAQVETLKKSEMMEDNVTILCDGIWRRVSLKPESERNWDLVKKKFEEFEATARTIGFELLEAAAIRARLTVLAEFEQDIDAALALSEPSLQRIKDDNGRFLIMEVTGRQLSYAGRNQEAVTWLERAIACNAYHYSVLRRNVLITIAELYAPHDHRKAAASTGEAVRICQAGKLLESIYIEALAEHGIALWKAGEGLQSFETFEEATILLFSTRTDTDSWRGHFARLFGVIAYFSGVAHNGKPQEGHVEPEQGLFLSGNDQAHTFYRPEQLSYICIRLAMFAEAVKDISKAATWTWKAIELAKQNATSLTAIRLQSWYAMPATLLADDFVKSAQLAALMMEIDVDSVTADAKASLGIAAEEKVSALEAMFASVPPDAPKSSLLVIPIVSIVFRLAFLKLRGATAAETTASLADIESVIPPDRQPENFVTEIRRALVEETDWKVLQDEGNRALHACKYARGYVMCIGAIDKAPSSQSLYLQTYVAQQLESLSTTCLSIYREIVAPFFVAYWERAVADPTYLFRTALAFTERQIQLGDGSAQGTRRLLDAMPFCLGVTLPEGAMKWLDTSS